jgi:LPXTG-site transpeptidase (sortase) family protein
MVRYNYREGVTLEKKKSRWFVILIGIIIIAAAAYVAAVYLAPQLVTVPFTSLTADATDKKIQDSKAGQYGDRLFLPQINVDVAVNEGGDQSQLENGAWQRNAGLGNPDKGGNFVLSGLKFTWDMTPQWTRQQSPFYNLGKLKNGDELTLDYKGKRYVYKVDRTFDEMAGNIEQKSDDYRLTLYATNAMGNPVAGAAVSATRISPVVQQDDSTVGFGGTAE